MTEAWSLLYIKQFYKRITIHLSISWSTNGSYSNDSQTYKQSVFVENMSSSVLTSCIIKISKKLTDTPSRWPQTFHPLTYTTQILQPIEKIIILHIKGFSTFKQFMIENPQILLNWNILPWRNWPEVLYNNVNNWSPITGSTEFHLLLLRV